MQSFTSFCGHRHGKHALTAILFISHRQVDLYRTLADLSGVGLADVQPGVQGTSLAPLFQDPKAAAAVGRVAYSQIARAACTTYVLPRRPLCCAMGGRVHFVVQWGNKSTLCA